MFRMITCKQKTLFFGAVGDIFRTEELALLVPQVMLLLLLKSDHCECVGWPLAGLRVQNGHFPSGKAAAINSHPAPALSSGCST